MFYHCIDLDGNSCLCLHESLRLYSPIVAGMPDMGDLPVISTVQEIIRPTCGKEMIHKLPPVCEEKRVIVVELLRDVFPNKYLVETNEEPKTTFACVRRELLTCYDNERKHFVCGTCNAAHHHKGEIATIDACIGCKKQLCINCNAHAITVLKTNHCRQCRKDNRSITRKLGIRDPIPTVKPVLLPGVPTGPSRWRMEKPDPNSKKRYKRERSKSPDIEMIGHRRRVRRSNSWPFLESQPIHIIH